MTDRGDEADHGSGTDHGDASDGTDRPGGRVPADELGDVFGLVANRLRVDILLELWDRHPEPAGFSELLSGVDVRDSGKFNYHLDRLVPEFVRKAEEGYALTYAGQQAIGVAVSGSFTDADEVEVGPVPAGSCMFCSGDAEATYERGHVVVTCADCEELIAKMPIPPVSVTSVAPERVPEVFSDHLLTLTHRLAAGFCKRCHGRVDASLTALTDAESVTYRDALDVRFDCRQCGDWTNLNVGGVVMNHPAVTAFLFDAGVDLHETYVWEVLPLLDPTETLTDGDPPRLDLRIDLDGDALDLTVDASATVVDYERR